MRVSHLTSLATYGLERCSLTAVLFAKKGRYKFRVISGEGQRILSSLLILEYTI